ncbi:MAG TPA: hypothetical protein VMZ71_03715 [Gemmataceae bacterium]|nr:hypothetical protein [Gemmataceae bacterium]
MSRLGDFLELVLGPRRGYQTVRAVIRNWQSDDPASRRAETRPSGRRKANAEEPKQPDHEEILRVWFAPPNKARIERVTERGGRRVERLTVQNDTHWWERDHEGHVESGERSDGRGRSSANLTDAERHFGDSQLREFIERLSLEAVGDVTCVGRRCVRVKAVPREGRGFWPHWISFGGDTYELHADPERGVFLALRAFGGGKLCETHEVQEVAFDEPLDDALFTYELRHGEQVRKPDPICEHMSLAAAVSRMSFTVLVPTDPELVATDCHVMWHPPRLGGGPPHLMLMYMGESQFWLNQSDADIGRKDLEWEPVSRNGRALEISDPGEEGERFVRFTHLGTNVEIHSDLPRERLLDIAASLEPAKPG